MEYEYKNTIYSKNGHSGRKIEDLLERLAIEKKIEKDTNNCYWKRGLDGSSNNNLEEFLYKLVYIEDIDNKEIREKIIREREIHLEAERNKPRVATIDDHYDSVRRDAFMKIGVYHY